MVSVRYKGFYEHENKNSAAWSGSGAVAGATSDGITDEVAGSDGPEGSSGSTGRELC